MTARERIAEQAAAPPTRAGGKPLAPGVRGAMEARLGHSFGHVRVHADGHAAASAREVGARAYAVGHDIVFGAGQLSAGTPAGRALLAHELAHVVQQGVAGDAGADAAEAEARAASRSVFSPRLRTGRQLALQAEEEPAPADEAPLRAEHAAATVMLQEEGLSFVRDRVAAATYSITRGVAELRKRPEAERGPLRAKVHAVEVELARALTQSAELLTARIPELEARAAAGEDVKAEIAATRRELQEAKADLDTMKGVFSPAKGVTFEEAYRTKLEGRYCMVRAYAGLAALTSPEQSADVKRQVDEKAEASLKRKGPDLDQFITVMDTANADRIAGPKQRAGWRKSKQRWTPTLDGIVRAHVNTKYPGLYFFGLALAEAYHSVIIGVSTWEKPARMLWCDQSGCERVRGTLDAFAKAKLENYPISYGDWDTYIWQVLPPAAASLLGTPEGTP